MKYRLGNICKIGDGLHGTPNYCKNNEFYFINGNNLKGELIDLSNARSVSKAEYLKYNPNLIPQKTVLLSINGTLGNTAIYNGESIILSKSVAFFECSTDIITPEYLKLYFESCNFQNILNNMATGTTIKNVGLKSLRSLMIDLPSINIQREIVNIIKPFENKLYLNNQINDNLVELINLIYLKFCADFPAKEKVSLDDVFNTSTKTFNVNENKNINIWHFSIPNFDCNKQPQCESTNSIKSNKKKVNSFGVLVSKLNPNFKRIWAPNLDFYSNYSPIASPEFIQINGNSQEEQALIFCILNSEEYTDFLVSNTTGSTNSRQRVKPKIAVSYIIPFDLDKKKGLESLVSPILKDIQQREFENTKLQIIKDTVLNKYF